MRLAILESSRAVGLSSLNSSLASAYPNMNGSVIESCCALLDNQHVVFVGMNEM